ASGQPLINVYVGATPLIVVCQLFEPATTCVRTVTSGETAATPASCAIAAPSAGVKVDAPPKPVRAPPCVTEPGCTTIRFDPSALMLLVTEVRAPLPIATVTMTAATPIT